MKEFGKHLQTRPLELAPITPAQIDSALGKFGPHTAAGSDCWEPRLWRLMRGTGASRYLADFLDQVGEGRTLAAGPPLGAGHPDPERRRRGVRRRTAQDATDLRLMRGLRTAH